jgi:uncharacterized protein (DUF1778 family)
MKDNYVRLDLRVPVPLRRLIRQAAGKSDTTASKWMREVLEREATKVLKEPEQ